jgi:chaperonin GroES
MKQPRGDRVLVRRLEAPQPKEGELSLPKSQQAPMNTGIVLAVGPGVRNRITGEIEPIDLIPGDIVDFFDFANTVTVDGEELLLLRDEEIWQSERPTELARGNERLLAFYGGREFLYWTRSRRWYKPWTWFDGRGGEWKRNERKTA